MSCAPRVGFDLREARLLALQLRLQRLYVFALAARLQRNQLRLRDIDTPLARGEIRLELIATFRYGKDLIALDPVAFAHVQFTNDGATDRGRRSRDRHDPIARTNASRRRDCAPLR